MGSFIVQDHQYYYYIKGTEHDGGPIYRMNKNDKTTNKVLLQHSVKYLTYHNGWLYFFKSGNSMSAIKKNSVLDRQGLYKMKVDGTSITFLTGKFVKSFSIIDGSIYMASTGGNFKMSTSGSKVEQLLKGVSVSEMFISDGWIYYTSLVGGKNTVNKIKIGSTKGQRLATTPAKRIVVVNDWIYYQNEKEIEIFRMKVDGTNRQKLADGWNMLVSTEGIYYFNRDEYFGSSYYYTEHLNYMNLDGTGSKRISVIDSFASYNLLGDTIYYTAYEYNAQMKLMRKDGSDWRFMDGKPIKVSSKIHATYLKKKGIPYGIDPSNKTMVNFEKSAKRAREIISSIIEPNMTDAEKLKAVHDYIVLNTAYDYENYEKDTIPDDSYTEYGVLFKGVAVCEGYAETMKLFLDLMEIDNYYVTGKIKTTNEGHAWNVVRIDGKYVQVDSTWDDPVPNRPGEVSYDYFMVTDDFMQQSRTWGKSQAPAAL